MNQRVRLTKRLLCDSLIELLSEKRLEEIKVKELCERAGINRSTFYAYYGAPRDVMIEMEKNLIGEIKRLTEDERIGVRERLIRICRLLYDNKKTELVLFANYTDQDLSMVFSFVDRELRTTKAGLIREPLTKEEGQLISSFVNFGLFNLIKTWLKEDIHKTPEEIADLILNKILRLKV